MHLLHEQRSTGLKSRCLVLSQRCPRSILLCEDGDEVPQQLHGLTPAGRLFPFAENNVVLQGEQNSFTGDFRGQEWAGASFSPDGKWLFANIQTPGITFAITGPWGESLL